MTIACHPERRPGDGDVAVWAKHKKRYRNTVGRGVEGSPNAGWVVIFEITLTLGDFSVAGAPSE